MSLFDHLKNPETASKLSKDLNLTKEPISELEVGMVIRIFDKVADKIKWLVILGIQDDKVTTGMLRINSEPNENFINTKELKDLQYPLLQKDNDFLKWDSYVNCAELLDLSHPEILTHAKANPDQVLGSVTPDDLRYITQTVVDSPTITPKQLKKYNLV